MNDPALGEAEGGVVVLGDAGPWDAVSESTGPWTACADAGHAVPLVEAAV